MTSQTTTPFVELTTDVSASPLWNPDLAPATLEQRKWSIVSLAALWIAMSACITTYTLAASLITGGMNWWQAVVTIFIGNVIVLIPMVLNAHPGTKYGIPFPVYCRASFGTKGANIPAMLRALVACGWFGIQTWIGGEAFFAIAAAFYPNLADKALHPAVLGVTGPQFIAFMAFWAINMLVIYLGIESIRILLNIKAPLLIILGLILLGWAYRAAGGFGPMMNQPSAFAPGQPQAGKFWAFFFPALTGVVGYWATLSLNIPDFTRYAKSQRDQIWGQALGLPTTMALYSFIGIAVTSATITIFGKAIWDPVVLLSTFHSKTTIIIAMGAIAIATLATNIAANVVSPANDFSNLAPKWINFRRGGFITGVIGIAMMPWKLYADPNHYIFTWLIAYSALLGAIAGILICDYYVIRRTELKLAELFNPTGFYTYIRGFNYRAIAALIIAVAPCVPGFLHYVGIIHSLPAIWDRIYTYAWFVTFALAFIIYAILMIQTRNNEQNTEL